VGHPKYPNSPGPPSTVTAALRAIRALPGHDFWADSISLADNALVDASLFSSHSRVTDSYLLALARANKGQLATLDHQLATQVVPEGKAALALI
jgi:predicted nucleic acid-binding protein